MRFLLLVFFLTANILSVAQQQDSLNLAPAPQGGTSAIASAYLRINFTARQRAILGSTKLELMLLVDRYGNPSLEKVTGVTDRSIIDSLINTTASLPPFRPATMYGEPTEGFYGLLLQFPPVSKTVVGYHDIPRTYRALKREDFEEIRLGGRMDVLLGFMTNGFLGNAADYLGPGGGFKVDLTFSGKHRYGGGFSMEFYGNNRTSDFPIDPSRVQSEAPVTLMLGLLLNKSIHTSERAFFLLQFEPAYTRQNISAKDNNPDKKGVELHGFSPGITAHYALRIGKERISSGYDPGLFGHCINFHCGVRPLFYNMKAGSGIMYEIGLSYRLVYNFIEAYTLKD